MIALAGTIGQDAEFNYQSGINAFHSIIKQPSSLDDSIEYASKWLKECARNIYHSIQIGMKMNQTKSQTHTTKQRHFVL